MRKLWKDCKLCRDLPVFGSSHTPVETEVGPQSSHGVLPHSVTKITTCNNHPKNLSYPFITLHNV